MKEKERCCRDCEFYGHPSEDKGVCRFNAPFPSMKSPMMNEKFFADATITWPPVQPEDWCGRYKARGVL